MLLSSAAPSLHGGHHVQNVLAHLPAAHNSTTHFYDAAILDHFSGVAGASHRWSQRFYVDQRFWCGAGCPVFLYIGGEGPQGPVSDHIFMSALAAKYGALMLALEHRFYGESVPFGNHSHDRARDKLGLLSIEQAMADSGLRAKDLHSIELVGGFSRMPALQAVLQEVPKPDIHRPTGRARA